MGLDEGLKVSYLTNGNKASHLQVVTTHLANPALCVNFDDSADLYCDCERVAEDTTLLAARNVSSVQTGEVVEIEDRFYTDDEYDKMSKKQKEALRNLRAEKGPGVVTAEGEAVVTVARGSPPPQISWPAFSARWGIKNASSRP